MMGVSHTLLWGLSHIVMSITVPCVQHMFTYITGPHTSTFHYVFTERFPHGFYIGNLCFVLPFSTDVNTALLPPSRGYIMRQYLELYNLFYEWSTIANG